MKVSLRDVARQAGVSPMTVSRVINNAASVKPETRQRVEEVIAATGYIPNRLAQGLISQRTGTLGLIIPDVSNPFFALVLRAAEITARREGYRVLVCNTEGDAGLERDYIHNLISHQVDGLMVAPVGDRSRNGLLPLMQRSYPLVLLDRSVQGIECDLVQGDSAGGAQRLIRHLLAVGHRRIAIILGPDDVSTTRERYAGYCGALDAAKLPLDRDLVVETTVDQPGGYRAMQQILRLDARPSAVFAVNNMTAMGAMQALREQGLAVPDAFGLVCFDDVEHLAILAPFMTVVDQPAEAFGAMATQMLLERIGGRAPEKPRLVRLPTTLIIRVSCGAGLAGFAPEPGPARSEPWRPS
jgi:LacI family transcriptional regulator